MPRRRSGEQLSGKQELMISALLSLPTQAQAAASVGVSQATLNRWLREERFQSAYRAARARVQELAVGSLVATMMAASEALARNLRCGQPAAEIRSAVAIFDLALRAHLELELEQRLEQLEVQSDAA